jgi:hypothetical protein
MFLVNTTDNNNNININMNISVDKENKENKLNLFKINTLYNKLYPFNYLYTPIQYLIYPQLNYNIYKNNIINNIKINNLNDNYNTIFTEYISDYSKKKLEIYYNNKFRINDRIKKLQSENIKVINKHIKKNFSNNSIKSSCSEDIICIYNDDYVCPSTSDDSDKDSDDTITEYLDDDSNKYMDSIYIQNNIINKNNPIKIIKNFYIYDEYIYNFREENFDNLESLEIFIRKNKNKKFDWYQILTNYSSLSEEFIEDFIHELGGWNLICKHLHLSENFIRKHKYEVDWLLVTKYQELSIPFICEFQHCLNWKIISQFNDLPEDFIRFFKHMR